MGENDPAPRALAARQPDRAQPKLYCLGARPPAEREPTALLSFALPPALALRVPAGRWGPCQHGVRLDVGADGVVAISGYDRFSTAARAAVLDQARRFLAVILDSRAVALPPAVTVAQLGVATGCGTAERPELFSIAFGARAVLARRERWHEAPVLV